MYVILSVSSACNSVFLLLCLPHVILTLYLLVHIFWMSFPHSARLLIFGMLFSLSLSAVSYLSHMSFFFFVLYFLSAVSSACHRLYFCCVSYLLHVILLLRCFVSSAFHSLSFCCVLYLHVILFLQCVRTFAMSFSFCCVLYLRHVILFLLCVRTFWHVMLTFSALGFKSFFTVLPTKPMLQSTLQQPVLTTDVDNRCSLLVVINADLLHSNTVLENCKY